MQPLFWVKVILFGCGVFLAGCGHMTTTSARDVTIGAERPAGYRVSQVELQQDIQRTTTVFMARIEQASEPLLGDARARGNAEVLLKRVLSYDSEALDIASGPVPEVNTLDMLVFAMLCRGALERHWIPRYFGRDAKPLVAVFEELEKDSWQVASKILDRQAQTDLRDLVAEWQRQNPDQVLVEGIRFPEFSEQFGDITKARAAKARGVMRRVKAATLVADQALLLSERAFFVAHRMPFLIRLQGRVGVQETLSDSLSRLDNVKTLFGEVPALRPLLSDLLELTSRAGVAAHEARMLMATVDPQLQRLTETDNSELVSGMTSTLESANRLTERSLLLVREMRATLSNDPERSIAVIEERVDAVLQRWIVYLSILGFAWSLFFWSGYVLAKRWTARKSR